MNDTEQYVEKFENNNFVLIEARLKENCDGIGNFETFPLIYPDNKNTLTNQTYTNPYFPNFKLVYLDSWKFNESTDENLNRTVVLTNC